jgi:uncharacterized protein (DUF1697 family)
MTRYVALLRAVNLGGATQVDMATFRSLLEARGFRSVRTLLQSGNAIFDAGSPAASGLESQIEDDLRGQFGREATTMVRTSEEWAALRRANPYPHEARDDPAHLVVTFLKTAPSTSQWNALDAGIEGRETVRGHGREAYIVYPDGIGSSKLTALRIERFLGTSGTSRNWNTVERIAAALVEAPIGGAGVAGSPPRGRKSPSSGTSSAPRTRR